MKIRQCFLLLMLACFSQAVPTVKPSERPKIPPAKLKNGCTFYREKEEGVGGQGIYAMPFPFLNCSNLNKNFIDLRMVPNNTMSISLTYNRMTRFNIDSLANFTVLQKLDLKHNFLEDLTPSSSKVILELPSLVFLFLSHNKLTKIPTNALRSFPSLISMEIYQNRIEAIEAQDLAYNPKIRYLGLGPNPITSISSLFWKNFTESLNVLSLEGTGLQEIPPEIANMSNLLFLSLANNRLTTVKGYSFNRTISLHWLELSSNAISSLDKFAFTGAENLVALDLSDNLLETLPEDVFSNMRDENMAIEMYENPLTCDCSLYWLKFWTENLHSQDIRYKCLQPKRNHGKKAYELELSDFSCNVDDVIWEETCKEEDLGNPTAETPTEPSTINNICPTKCKCFDSGGVQYAGDVSGVKRRRFWQLFYPEVDCSGAGLHALPDSIRKDVKTLDLSDNNIRSLDIKNLRQYTSLKSLIIKGSGLKEIKPDPKVLLENLITLSIQRNNLTSLTKNHLKSFPNLKTLRMYHNRITNFPRDLFSYNQKLYRLVMGNNPVKNFDSQCLQNLKLVSLSLRNMSLRAVPRLSYKKLVFLELSDNNITKLPNGTFKDAGSLTRLILENNGITEIGAKAFQNTTNLRSLDLSENKISTLPRGVFDEVSQEKLNVELWVNDLYCDCRLRWFKSFIEKLEAEDPTSEIRFMCTMPLRMYGKLSNDLSPSDFTCDAKDEKAIDRAHISEALYNFNHGTCYTGGSLAISVILTMIFTLIFTFLIRCCLQRRKGGYARYSAKSSSTSQLDMDM